MTAAWNLPQRIIELSTANTWAEAVQEWVPNGIDILENETSECLCGHKPIVELCHILNTVNNNTAIVGNHCIQKFNAEDPAHAVFGNIPKIISAAKRILNDPINGSANEELIDMAHSREVLTANDATFYKDICKKRKLSEKQINYKMSLNKKLLYQMLLTPLQALKRLEEAPTTRTAGPRLINYAFGKGILSDQSKTFYLQIWNRANASLSVKQLQYKQNLNQAIIKGLKQQPQLNRQLKNDEKK